MTNETKNAIPVTACLKFQLIFLITVRFILSGFEPQSLFITFGLLDDSNLAVTVKVTQCGSKMVNN